MTMVDARTTQPPMPQARPGFERVQRQWDATRGLWMARILPGEYFVTRGNEGMTTVLGSCVAACIRDPRLRVGGMNHFMLPEAASQENPIWGGPDGMATRYGAYAMEQLINELMKMGARRERLEVKLFGGGKILAAGTDVGDRNIAFAREFLHQESLAVIAEDLGDVHPRRVMYFPRSGAALVKRLPSLDIAGVARREAQYIETLAGQPIVDDVELFT